MRNKKYFLIISIALLLVSQGAVAQICNKPFHIVVLGSSTAAGDGASNYAHAWVGKFTDSLKRIDTAYVVDNLAVAGTTTYAAQPTDYTPPAGRPSPLAGHNISAALKLHPDAIIINYPSNDAAEGYSLSEQKENFKRITNRATESNVPVWVSTTQPRNNFSAAQVKSQDKLFTWIKDYYKEKAIDFQTGLATAKDSILYKYDSGDGIHLNNAGHAILYKRVLKKDIPDSLCLRSNAFPVSFAGKKP